jgi:hypothetical protein
MRPKIVGKAVKHASDEFMADSFASSLYHMGAIKTDEEIPLDSVHR